MPISKCACAFFFRLAPARCLAPSVIPTSAALSPSPCSMPQLHLPHVPVTDINPHTNDLNQGHSVGPWGPPMAPRFLWDLSLLIFQPACGHFLSMGPCFPEHFDPAHKWHFHAFQALCPFPFQASCLFPFQALCHFHLHSTYHAASFPPGLVCWGPLKSSHSPHKNSKYTPFI